MAARSGSGSNSPRTRLIVALVLLATIALGLTLFSAETRRSQKVLRQARDEANALTAKATAKVALLQKTADKLVAERRKELEEAKSKAARAESEHAQALKEAQDKVAEAESKKTEAEGKLKEAESKKTEAVEMAQLHTKTAQAAKDAEGEAEKLRQQLVALKTQISANNSNGRKDLSPKFNGR